MAEKVSYTPAGSLKGERDEAEDEEREEQAQDEEAGRTTQAQDEEEAQAKAFLDGYVQETADGDIDLDASSAKKIKQEEEAIRMQFDQLGNGSVHQAYLKGRELARVGERISLQHRHENEIQELVDKTDLNDVPNTVQVITDTMFHSGQGQDITTGRLVALLTYCYKLIEKMLRERPEVVIGTVVVGAAAAIILYQVFKRIDFFKIVVRRGGWAALQYAQESVDAGMSAISRWWYGSAAQTVVGAGITVAPIISATETRLAGHAAATLSRSVPTSIRFGAVRVLPLLPAALPVAAVIALAGAASYYLWERQQSE